MKLEIFCITMVTVIAIIPHMVDAQGGADCSSGKVLLQLTDQFNHFHLCTYNINNYFLGTPCLQGEFCLNDLCTSCGRNHYQDTVDNHAESTCKICNCNNCEYH